MLRPQKTRELCDFRTDLLCTALQHGISIVNGCDALLNHQFSDFAHPTSFRKMDPVAANLQVESTTSNSRTNGVDLSLITLNHRYKS